MVRERSFPHNERRLGCSRRQFLGGALAAGVLGVPLPISRNVLASMDRPGANERIGVGAIGVGHRASLLLDQLPEDGRIVALCDCNLPRAEEYKADKKGSWPVYQDYRKVLDRKDVDAVVVSTGEFQRVLPCIHACQAEKDIYGEKPLTLYIREGRALVSAVRRYRRVFQVGSQQRSMAMNRIACELVRSGGLGKVLKVLSVNHGGPEDAPATPFPEQLVPKGLDWDTWLNQAAWRPFNQEWMAWTQWRDFAGGQMTNYGAHSVDQIQWALGMDDTGPVEMRPLPNGRLEMRYANDVPVRFVLDRGPDLGAIFVCEKGKLEINRNKFTSNPKSIAAELLKKVDEACEEKKWDDQTALWQARWHMQNWLDCIRTRQRPVADVEIGHRSVSMCHLATITRRIGRRLQWDPVKEQFVGDEQANKLVSRPRRQGWELPDTL